MDERSAEDRLEELKRRHEILTRHLDELRRQLQFVPTVLSWVYPGKRLPKGLYPDLHIDPDPTNPE